MFEKVCDIICDQMDVDRSTITMETRLAEDLHADSVEMVGVIMNLEEEFGVQFPFEELEQIKTVGDAVKYIESKV